MGGDLTTEQMLAVAMEVAPKHRRLKDVFAAANEKLGIDKSSSAWRGIFHRNQDMRRQLYEAMGERGGAPVAVRQSQTDTDFDVEKFFELQLRAAAEWRKRHVDNTRIDIAIDTDEPVVVCFTSDWHVGGKGTEHLQIKADNEFIAAHPNFFAYVGGDWSNNFVIPVLQHAGMSDIFSSGDQQYEIVRYLLQILLDSDKVLAIGDGNHIDWTKRMAAIDPRSHLLRDIPHLYTVNGSLMTLKVGEQEYRIFRRHKPRFSSHFNPGHSVIKEYQTGPYDFDAGVLEHHHEPFYGTFNGKYREDGSTTRIAIRPGTYKTIDDHADKGGFYGASSDMVCVIFHPERFWMQPVRGLQNAADIVDGMV